MEILTPQMIAERATAYLKVEMDCLKGIPRPLWAQPKPDTRSPWKKAKDRINSRIDNWRHSLACWITPYGFDD